METVKYTPPTKWEDCKRDDLNIIPKMISEGFIPKFSYNDTRHNRTTPENCPHDAVGFFKGDLHVWKCYKFSTSFWQTATLVNGIYTNHKPINNLSELFGSVKIN